MQRRAFQVVLLVMVLLPLAGCGGSDMIYPTTSGSHTPLSQFDATGPQRYIVWSNYQTAQQYLTGELLAKGNIVVERARLEAIFKEQRLTLTHTPADVLRVGKLVGASHVIFAEVITKERDPTAPVTVTVRNVKVESGEVVWSGMASVLERVASHDEAARVLTAWAVERATCPIERGYTWIEPTGAEIQGCVNPKGSVGNPTWYDPGIWQKR